jgi:excisionase family DNA binding protein
MPKGVKTLSNMLRTGEACHILCIHANTLRRWSEQGIIKAYRVGPRGDRRFRREDVAALLIEHTKDSSRDKIKLSHQ